MDINLNGGKKISVICACNNRSLVEDMLLPSLQKQTYGNWETVIVDAKEKGFTSAAQTLNYGASVASGEILMFVHQDIEFADKDFLLKLLDYFENYEFGVGGVAGVIGSERLVYASVTMDVDHKMAGVGIDAPKEMDTLDECCFFVNKDDFKGFTDYGSWHFYAVEYSLRCQEDGQRVMIFPLDLYHLSPGWSLNNSYWATLKKVAKRHKGFKYIPTTMGVYKNGFTLPLEIFLRKTKRKIKRILNKSDSK